MKYLAFILFLFFSFLPIAKLVSQPYYVSTTGTGDGSINKPWGPTQINWTTVGNNLPTSLYFEAGVYNTTYNINKTVTNPSHILTITKKPNTIGDVVFDGGYTTAGPMWKIQWNYLVLKDVTIKRCTTIVSGQHAVAVELSTCTGVILDGINIEQCKRTILWCTPFLGQLLP
jgi:hypothetical protein